MNENESSFYELPSCFCRRVLSAVLPEFGEHVCHLRTTSDLPGRQRGRAVSERQRRAVKSSRSCVCNSHTMCLFESALSDL